MEQEVKGLLEENLRLSKENNLLLQKLYKIQRWVQITRILYWIVIIGVSFGAFYYVKPYLGSLVNVYSGGVTGLDNITEITKSLSDKQQVQDLLKSLNE